jgi:hypothetical protein
MFTEKFIKFLQLIFLSRDELDELGEGDFREVAFADGSLMKPRATGGNGLPQVGGWRIEEPSRGRW